MTRRTDLELLAEEYGILPEFRDLSGTTRATAPETQRALLRANGLAVDNDAAIRETLAERRAMRNGRMLRREKVIAVGEAVSMPLGRTKWTLSIEGGREMEGRGDLPPLPPGIHDLTVAVSGQAAEHVRLIAAPAACPSVEDVTGHSRVWGMNAALYGLRSVEGGGMGDFRALARAVEGGAAHGADFFGINPVHSLGWADHGTTSPYSPSHRGFLNAMHVHLPGGRGAGGEGASDRIDYPAVMATQRAALEAAYRAFDGNPDFDAFRAERGAALATFARYEALSEIHGPDWRTWSDADLPPPDPARVRFHEWMQWRADAQLSEAQARAKGAGMGMGLYLDLAVGPRRGGAESWCEAGAIAQGVSLGAPPDHLGPDGQNWQLAAYAPGALAALDYAPLRRIIAETMRHAGVLRIDHVIGMTRTYWIPDDGSPGGYIRQPLEPLLAIVAIEAAKAGTVVIGEDLGLVPPGFRDSLRARGLYGYSVLQYERDGKGRLRPPTGLRRDSLLCFGTHDTPTLRGFWTGQDIAWWRRLGWIDAAGEASAQEQRKADRTVLGGAADYPAVKARVHDAMAKSPAAMVAVQLDDLLDHEQAQNLPGTIDEHPNWQRRYALPVEHLADDPATTALAETMRAGRRAERDERNST